MNERTIFLEALEQPPERRDAFLHQMCGDNDALRRGVDALLLAHSGAGSFIEHPPLDDATAKATDQSGETDDRTKHCHPAGNVQGSDGLDLSFLQPSIQPDHLGRFGPYEILEVIGTGAFGIVLRALDPKLNRVVAIKVLKPSYAANALSVRRFLQEAQAAAAVSHDHVVTIYAVDDASALPYLVMEFVSGRSLQQKLDQEGALPVPEILRIGMQIAAGLAAAHRQGLVHRDIKPGNILLENGIQRVKITDFGLARAVDDLASTMTMQVAGTPQYMSPEQACGRVIDQRSDLFSLGSVMYAMCTGRPAFRADSILGILKQVCDDVPQPIRELNPEVPDWLIVVIDRLLEKSPDKRYQTSAEVADLLEAGLSDWQQHRRTFLPNHRVSNAGDPGNRSATSSEPLAADRSIQPPGSASTATDGMSTKRVVLLVAGILLAILMIPLLLIIAAAGYFVVSLEQQPQTTKAHSHEIRQGSSEPLPSQPVQSWSSEPTPAGEGHKPNPAVPDPAEPPRDSERRSNPDRPN